MRSLQTNSRRVLVTYAKLGMIESPYEALMAATEADKKSLPKPREN